MPNPPVASGADTSPSEDGATRLVLAGDEATRLHMPPDNASATTVTTSATTSVNTASVGPATTAAPAGARSNALPVGSRVGEFEITGVIGVGGFGIVYLAMDTSLGRTVALKEYMPSSFAMRVDANTVRVLAEEHRETFAAGLRSFVNEAQLLAQFDHPSLVKVYRFWEANGTAYMVMPYYDGQTLKTTLTHGVTPPDEAWLRNFVAQILQALDIIHAKQCYHRDIAPDNILMQDGLRPVLLDFGAARRVIEGREQALTVILKAGYAPIEQYGADGEMGQGPWTDLYALASVIYFAIMKKTPPPAVQRVVGVDPYQALEQQVAGRYSTVFLRSIDAALALQPKARPQNVAEFRALLDADPTRIDTDVTMVVPRATPAVAAALASVSVPTAEPNAPAPQVEPAGQAKAFHPGGAGKWLAAAATVALLGGVAWWFGRTTAPPPPPTLASASASTAPAEPTRAEPTTTSATPATAASMAAVSAKVMDKVMASAAQPVVLPFDPARMLNDLIAAGNPQHEVTTIVGQQQVRIGKDNLRFEVRSARDGYVYVLMLDAKHEHLYLMFPNVVAQQNRIKANEPLRLPGKHWPLVAQGPAGTDQFVVLVSEAPRDFAKAGLQKGDPFAEFDLNRLKAEWASKPQPLLFAGQAKCEAGTPCPDGFGAAGFVIEEVEKR